MIDICKQALDAARKSEIATRMRIRAWVFVCHNGESQLVSISMISQDDVAVSVIWRGPVGALDVQMVADYMNESLGIGPHTVSALQNIFCKGASEAASFSVSGRNQSVLH